MSRGGRVRSGGRSRVGGPGARVGAAVVVAGCASGPSVAAPAPIASPDEPGTTLPVEGTPVEVSDHRDDWVLPGPDHANSGATPGSAIDSTNVRTLAPAWEVEMAGTPSTVPIIVGDTIYVQDGRGT